MRKTSHDTGDSYSITSGVENELKKPLMSLLKNKKGSLKRKPPNSSKESDDTVVEPLINKEKEKPGMSQSAKFFTKPKTEADNDMVNDKSKLINDNKIQNTTSSPIITSMSVLKDNAVLKSVSTAAPPIHNYMNTNIFNSHDGIKVDVTTKSQILVEIDASKPSGYSPSPLIFTTAKIHTDGKTQHMEPVQLTPVPILSTVEASLSKSGNITTNEKKVMKASNGTPLISTVYNTNMINRHDTKQNTQQTNTATTTAQTKDKPITTSQSQIPSTSSNATLLNQSQKSSNNVGSTVTTKSATETANSQQKEMPSQKAAVTTSSSILDQKKATAVTTNSSILDQKKATAVTTNSSILDQKKASAVTTSSSILDQKKATAVTTSSSILDQKTAAAVTTISLTFDKKNATAVTTSSSISDQKKATAVTTNSSILDQKKAIVTNQIAKTVAQSQPTVSTSNQNQTNQNIKQREKSLDKPTANFESVQIVECKPKEIQSQNKITDSSTVPNTPSTTKNQIKTGEGFDTKQLQMPNVSEPTDISKTKKVSGAITTVKGPAENTPNTTVKIVSSSIKQPISTLPCKANNSSLSKENDKTPKTSANKVKLTISKPVQNTTANTSISKVADKTTTPVVSTVSTGGINIKVKSQPLTVKPSNTTKTDTTSNLPKSVSTTKSISLTKTVPSAIPLTVTSKSTASSNKPITKVTTVSSQKPSGINIASSASTIKQPATSTAKVTTVSSPATSTEKVTSASSSVPKTSTTSSSSNPVTTKPSNNKPSQVSSKPETTSSAVTTTTTAAVSTNGIAKTDVKKANKPNDLTTSKVSKA